jgi:uncharacterized protein (TIGR02246 family)
MRTKLIPVGLGALILLVGISAHFGLTQPPAKDNQSKNNNANAEQAIRKAAAAYVQAMNKCDLDAIMSFWAPDADFVDETGKATRGREALTELFKQSLPAMKGSKFAGKMLSLKFPRPEVALEDGSLEVTDQRGTRESNRYAIVWIKSGDKWLISSVRDLPVEVEAAPSLPYLRLKPLEWLVGQWKNDGPKTEVQINCRWAANKAFLLMRYDMRRENQEPMTVNVRIGWDPVNNRMRSWAYDSLGGFGEGYWTRDGNRWVVGCSGVLPDGGTGESTNVYEFKDSNTFLWRSVDRQVDSQPLSDIEVKFVRKSAK